VGVNERIILKWCLKTGCKGLGRIYLPQNRHIWWAVVKVVMNFGFLKIPEISRLGGEFSGFETASATRI
jgi:hypothetical protein